MRLPLAVAVFSLLLAAISPDSPAGPSLLVISIDGLGPALLDRADELGLALPNLREIRRQGASARGVRGVLPTVTYPSHVTLVTGVRPARHGVLTNHPFDPLGVAGARWTWYAEDVRVPALWDVAHAAGLSTAAVDWPVTVGAKLDWNLPQCWRPAALGAPDDAKLFRALGTPGLLTELERELGPYPTGYAVSLDDDRRKAAFSVRILETRRPRLHLAYLTALDEVQHYTGPESEQTAQTLIALDALVGDLRRAAERGAAGPLTVAVVSDHGLVRTDHEVHLQAALREAGLLEVRGGRVASWRATAWSTGGSAAVMLRDPADAEARQRVGAVLRGLAEQPEHPVDAILDEAQARAAGGFPGAAWVTSLRPPFRFGEELDGAVVRSAWPAGTHGYHPDRREMDAVLLIAGPGVPHGLDLGRAELVDVAPTLAGRLGLELPEAEGRDLLATR
jgi:predicted AlkP superfamily pyrophosphatase or phosphodiesterase